MSLRELIVLGTASQVPTRRRSHNGYLLRWDGEGILFDPGEGTQRQMLLAGVAASDVTRICVTHFHGDHTLGLPGVIQRLSLDGVRHPVMAHFPASGAGYFANLRHATAFHESADVRECPITGDGPLDGQGIAETPRAANGSAITGATRTAEGFAGCAAGQAPEWIGNNSAGGTRAGFRLGGAAPGGSAGDPIPSGIAGSKPAGTASTNTAGTAGSNAAGGAGSNAAGDPTGGMTVRNAAGTAGTNTASSAGGTAASSAGGTAASSAGGTAASSAGGTAAHDGIMDSPAVGRRAGTAGTSAVAGGPSGTLEARRLSHTVDTYGYRLVEPDGRRMLPERLAGYGIAGPAVGQLQRTGHLDVNGRRVTLEEVSAPRRGQRFAFVMDTRLCDGVYELAAEADLLVIEATFLQEDARLAADFGHLTAAQAAQVAQDCGVRRLVLTHFSQRYADPSAFADEARQHFTGHLTIAEDLMRIPVPPRR